MFKSKAEKEREERDEEKQQKKIEEFQKKCNFLSPYGCCDLTDIEYEHYCSYDECIFMKILNCREGSR